MRNGVCRVMPPLAEVLSETGPTWQEAAYPLSRSIAARLSSVGLSGGRAKKRPGYEARIPPMPSLRRKLDGRRARPSHMYRGRRVL
jgi:hypothetical protein